MHIFEKFSEVVSFYPFFVFIWLGEQSMYEARIFHYFLILSFYFFLILSFDFFPSMSFFFAFIYKGMDIEADIDASLDMA